MNADLRIIRNASLAGGLVIAAAAVLIAAPAPEAAGFLSSILPPILSVAAAVLAGWIFRRQRADRVGAKIWGAMTLGLVCWSLGELIYAYFELVEGQDVPSPSGADLLWLFGYLPLFFSVGYQYILLRASIPRAGRWLMAGLLAALAVLLALLVVVPILTSPESGSPVERTVAVAYPLGDILLLSLAMALGLVFLGGELALPWGVIAAGILLHAVSDLLFSYGVWNGMYYPDGELNFLSFGVDILYIGAYVVWNVGLFLRLRLPEPGGDVAVQSFIPEAGKGFLLTADGRGRVVFIDPALVSLLGIRDPGQGLGKPFGQLIGLARGYEHAAIQKASRTGISDDYTVRLGLSRTQYRLRVIASSDPDSLPGFDILVHPDPGSLEAERGREDLMLGRVATRAREQEDLRRGRLSGDEDPLRVYFNTMAELLYILIGRVGGAGVGEAFEKVLNAKARKAGLKFELRKGRAAWEERGTSPDSYRDLLEEALRYSGQVLSADIIDRKRREIEKHMDPAIVEAAQAARLKPGPRRNAEPG